MASDGSTRTQTDLRTYIPFLRRMIENLSRGNPDVSKDSQKDKLESLLEVITCSETRLRPETHQRCEKVLRKLYLKFEAGDNPHTPQDGSYVGPEVFQGKDSARLNSTRDYSLPFRNPDPGEEPSTAVMYHREAAAWDRPSSFHYDRWCENRASFNRSCEPGTERFSRDVHLDKHLASTLALSEEVTVNASSSRETLHLDRHSGSSPLFNPESSTSITKPKPVFPMYIEGQRRSRDPRSASRMLRTNLVDSSHSGQRENRPESFNRSTSLIPVHLNHQSYTNWETKSDARNNGTDRDIAVPVGSFDSIRQSSLKQNVKLRLDHNTTELERSYTAKSFEKHELFTPVSRMNNNIASVERSEHTGINFAPVSSITICGKNKTESVAGGFHPTGDVLGRGTNSVDSANHLTQPLRAIPNPPSMTNCLINQATSQTQVGNPETGSAEETARNLELKLELHSVAEMQIGTINKIPVANSAAFGELRPRESLSSQKRWEKIVAAKSDSNRVGLKDSIQQPSPPNAAPSEVKMETRMPEPLETFSSPCATGVMQSRHKLIPPCYSQPESKSEDRSNVVPVVASVAVGKLRRRRMSECQKRRRRAAAVKHNLTVVDLKDGVERTPPQNAAPAERKVEVPDPPEIFSSPCTVEVMQSDREVKPPFLSQPERKSDENSNEVPVAGGVAVGKLSRRNNLGKRERRKRAAAMKREMAVVGSKNGAERAPPQNVIPVELNREGRLLDPSETFSSPLNSLYVEPKPSQIGRGYGPQKCNSNPKNHTNIKPITTVSENASTETSREQAKYISQRGINDRIVSSSVMFSKHSDVSSTVATSTIISEGKSGIIKETLCSSEPKEPINQVPLGVSDIGRTPSSCLVENMSLHNLQNGKGQHHPLDEKGERMACPLISCYSSLTDAQSYLGKPVQETSCFPIVTEQQESEKLAAHLRLGQKSSVSQTATGQPVAKSTFTLGNIPADVNSTNHKTQGEKEFGAHNISQSTLENPFASYHSVNSGVPETVMSSKNSCQPKTVSLNLVGDYLKRVLPPEEASEVIERLRLSNETCAENSTQSEDMGIISIPERTGPVLDSSSSSSADVERIGIKDSEKPPSLTAVPAEDQNHSGCASHPLGIHSTKQSSFAPNQEKGKGCTPLKTSKKGVSALEIEGLRLDAAKFLEGLDVSGKRKSRSTLKTPSYTVFVPERVDMELENLSSPSAAGTEAPNTSHRRVKNEKRKAAVGMSSVPVVKIFVPESFFDFEPHQLSSQVSDVLDGRKSVSNERNDSPHTNENRDLLFQEKEPSVVRTPEHSSDCTATRDEKEDSPSKIVMSRGPKSSTLLVSRDSASNLSKAPVNPVIHVASKKRKSSTETPVPKRKKGLLREIYPLHDLDLCNLREICMGDTEQTPCHECTYVGQNIVHHYVNEHRGVEVPYSKVPFRNWNRPRVDLSRLPLQCYSEVSLNPAEISSSLTNRGSALCYMFRHSLGCLEDNEHLRLLSSTLDYKFRCLLCDKEELSYVNMYDHVTEHTGEFRFRCDHCGHRVAQQKDMVDHMRKFHELQDPPLFHTDPVAQDGYFIHGWVCCSCHYLQICEENMRKHLESGSCQNCRCVNLSEPVFDNSNSQSGGLTKAALTVQGVSARFSRRYSEAKKLAVTKHSWTRNLGSKLRQKLSDYQVGVVNDYDRAKEVFPLLIRVKPEMPSCDFEPLNEDRVDKSRIFQTSLVKLVEKLLERVNGVEKAVAENAFESAAGTDRVGWLPTVNNTSSVDIFEDNENFLKVASVISLDPRLGVSEESITTALLHTPDSRSSCDNVTCSTLTFQRGECEFPSTIPHNRANLAATLKDPSCYAIMMLREYVTDFFKCMSVRCTFTSNFQEQFLEHIKAHEKQNRNKKIVLHVDTRIGDQGNHISCPDFYLCSYCPFVGNSSVDLVEHLVSSHGRKRSYQCSGCFFRGVSLCHVQHHITQAHPNKPETAILQCDPISNNDTSLYLQEITAKDILHYRCTIEDCNYSCLSQNAYESHLCKIHSDVSSLSCSICGLVTSIGDITNHTTLHGLGLYQCPYCYYGSNSFDNVISHVTLIHPFGVVKVFVRDATKESSSETKEEINSRKSPVSALRNLCRSAVRVELDPSLWAATEHTRESTFQLRSEQRLDTVPVDAKSTCGDAEISGDTSTTIGSSSLEPVNCGVRIGSAVPSSCSIFGLTGHDLYKCGNVGCHFSAPDVEELKEHLCICDLARDCSTLKCFHCLKQFAAVPHLLDHLRAHGPRPYSCGVCQKRFDHVCRFGSHMKMYHRSLETTIATFELSSGTNHAQVYNVFPEDMIKNLNDLKALNISERIAFTSNDIPLIPAKSILREPLYCEDCGYSTKVTKNLIHHLMLHTDHSLESCRIPTTDPVNQMTNSTPIVYTPQGTSAESGEHVTDSNLTQIKYVPRSRRFTCAISGCRAVLQNEKQLSTHFVKHSSLIFHCPHCPTDDRSYTKADYFTHLKMHGPCLYNCQHCSFYHWQRMSIKQHSARDHPNMPCLDVVIRELQGKKETTRKSHNSWKCTLCKRMTSMLPEIVNHVSTQHGLSNQFQCVWCTEGFEKLALIETHYSESHPGKDAVVAVAFLRIVAKEETVKDVSEENLPLWSRTIVGPRYIRKLALAIDGEETLERREASLPAEPGPNPQVPVAPLLLNNASSEDPAFGPYGLPSNKLFCCPRCNWQSNRRDSFRRHLYWELKYNRFQCDSCEMRYISRERTKKHIKTKHQGLATVTEHPKDLAIEKWVNDALKFQRERFAKGGDHKSSTQAKPNVSAKTKVHKTADSTAVFFCGVCKLNFPSEEEILTHQEHHPGKPLRYRTIKIGTSASAAAVETEVSFECPVCFVCFFSREEAEKHLVQHEVAAKCGKCDYLILPTLGIKEHWNKEHSASGDIVVETAPEEVLKRGVRIRKVTRDVLSGGSVQETKALNESSLKEMIKRPNELVTVQSHQQETEGGNQGTLNLMQITAKREQYSKEDGFSFYGKTPEPVDLGKVFTYVTDSCTEVKITVDTLALAIPLLPLVKLRDCNCQ